MTKRLGCRLAAMLLAATPFPLAAAPAPANPIEARIDAILLQQQREQHIPGMAMLILKDGKVIYAKAFGVRDIERKLPVTLDTVFPIGSATKSFTSMALALSADDGTLSLDDHPRRYLPYFHMADPVANAQVTLRDMLSHRTGLRANADLAAEPGVLTMDQYVRATTSAKPAVPFRSAFQYSNAMVVAAGEIAGVANRASWSDVIQRRILTPLGMASTTPDLFAAMKLPNHATGYVYDDATRSWRATPPPQTLHVLAPAGSIASTAHDMARWLRMLSEGGMVDGKRFVSAAMFRELTTPKMAINAQLSYGLGWALYDWNGLKVIEHNGGSEGISALESFIPERHVAIVFLANTSPNYMTTIGNAGKLLWPIILGEAPAAPPPAAPEPAKPETKIAPDPTLPSAASLIARMIVAEGGKAALERHRSLAIDADKSYENQGITAHLTIRAAAPAKREELEAWHAAGRSIAHLRIYYDGAAGGQETTFGQDSINDRATNAQAAHDDMLHPLLHAEKSYSTITVTGRTQSDGEAAYLLRLTPAEGDPVTLIVSAASALVLARETPGTTQHFADYRLVDGERLPFRTTIQDALGDTRIDVRRARFNVSIPQQAFEAAAGTTPSGALGQAD